MFPLVPYSNRLGYRRFRWRGHDYTTRANVADSPHSLHGVGWQRPWRIVSSSALEVVLELGHGGDADWPFAFTARQYFALDAGVVQRAPAAHQRRPPIEQPAGLGWHPYFVKRARSRMHIELSDRWDSDATQLPTRKVAQPGIDSDLSHLDFDHCFEGWRGPARIRDERFSLQLASSLPYLVVYTPPERDYFCVEPVSHVSNAIHMADPARTAWSRSRRARRSRPGCGSTSPCSEPRSAHVRERSCVAITRFDHALRVRARAARSGASRRSPCSAVNASFASSPRQAAAPRGERARRLVERFVGELEGAPVDADRVLGARRRDGS